MKSDRSRHSPARNRVCRPSQEVHLTRALVKRIRHIASIACLFLVTLSSITIFCDAAANPSYLMSSLAQRSHVGGTGHLRHRAMLMKRLARDSNSLLLRSGGGAKYSYLLPRSSRSMMTTTARHMVLDLDFLNPLEPLEMLWEMYCNRYEIMEELLAKIAIASKNNLIRATVVIVPAFVIGDVLARFGVIGAKGEGLVGYVKKKTSTSERFRDGTRERAFQKTSAFLVDKGIDGFTKTFRMFGRRGKFAISVSAGAMFGQSVIRLTAFTVRVTLISFFVLETMSFLGIIGEQGESLLQWYVKESVKMVACM